MKTDTPDASGAPEEITVTYDPTQGVGVHPWPGISGAAFTAEYVLKSTHDKEVAQLGAERDEVLRLERELEVAKGTIRELLAREKKLSEIAVIPYPQAAGFFHSRRRWKASHLPTTDCGGLNNGNGN